ncbi:hypothetical protein R1flu_028539 [Riccia fluitans]|uniref:Uncharacterized protein n=1 Tax=Riccia fluitans TaxID=41844 RepID=A0ABD1XLZ4_9MARC
MAFWIEPSTSRRMRVTRRGMGLSYDHNCYALKPESGSFGHRECGQVVVSNLISSVLPRLVMVLRSGRAWGSCASGAVKDGVRDNRKLIAKSDQKAASLSSLDALLF